MKMNYFYAISSLIEFKSKHELIVNRKNESVLKYLHTVELRQNYESEEVPDVTKIASAVNLPRQKVNEILYQSYLDLLQVLENTPHQVSDYVHVIYITTYDDYQNSPNKEFVEEERKKHFWGEFKLPFTPRLGEAISIDFIDSNVKYNRGVVTEIHHEISSSVQRIIINVHPFKNYYWMWDRIKREHIQEEHWLARIRNER